MCCGRKAMGNVYNVIPVLGSTARSSPYRSSSGPSTIVSDAPPLLITDDVLFRWARIVKIAKIFPRMHELRAMESRVQAATCRGCQQSKQSRVTSSDIVILEEIRRSLAECSDANALAVKEAAKIEKYRVRFHDLSGKLKEVVR